MQEILQDIQDITYSREIYDAKPRPIASAFIYILLTMLTIAIAWTAIGTIDIVVKANGYVRPNQQISTVVNRVAGEVESVMYENGQTVKVGDLLYVVNHDDLTINQLFLEEKVKTLKEEIDLLNTYKESIKQQKNLFDPVTQELYYEKYEKFELDYLLAQNDYQYYENSTLQQQETIDQQIEEVTDEISMIDEFMSSIDNHKSSIQGKSMTATYYREQFEKYLLDYATLEQQYNDKAIEIQSGKAANLVTKNLEETQLEYDGYSLLLKSIEAEKSLFPQSNVYYDQYNQYRMKQEELQSRYNELKNSYELNLSLKGIAVTGSQVEQSRIDMDAAYNQLTIYKQDFIAQVTGHIRDLELELIELKNGADLELTKDKILENNQTAKERALEKFTKDMTVSVEELKTTNQKKLSSLQQSKEQLDVDKTKILTDENEATRYVSLKNYRSTELISVLSTIDSDTENLKQLESQLDQVNKDIDDSSVRAQIAGKINSVTDIAKGDSLFSGTQILTIIPENNTTFKVQILLANSDIAKISVGDPIKYHFQALPYREYGELTGYVTKIGSDAQIDKNSGQSYYYIEATLNQNIAYDYKGNASQVKTGMLCEAQVITDEKKILRFLLEKINLLED